MSEIILKEGQQKGFDETIEALRKGERRIVFQGSAGCGKTVVASELVRRIKKDRTVVPGFNNGHVFVTAPTNKALAVLQSKVNVPDIDFKTIHAALKLRRFIDPKTGEEKFIKASQSYGKKIDEFLSCRVCIIDECSMLSNKFIGGYTDDKGVFQPGYLDKLNIPIIFIGDEKQLNPVNEDYSPAFHQGWRTIELTEIIRQGAGNPIIDLSRDLDMIYFKQPRLIEGKGYMYDNNRGAIIDDLAEVNGTDELKYLSWTNPDVDEMNRLVRVRRYGEKVRKIERLETIVFNSPFAEFYTNQEVKVEDLDVYVETIQVPMYDTRFDKDNQPISKTDSIKMKFYRINDAINIVHEDSERIFKLISDNLKMKCKNSGWDWRGYYWFVEQFGDIKYNHAITCHKSQGSTYKQAVLNIANMDFNKNLPEKQRLLYTAVTRASDLVILYGVR